MSWQPTVCFADRAWSGQAVIQENARLARDTFRVRIHCPEIARTIVPGQFLMLRLAGHNDPLLGRPLALYDTTLDEHGEPASVDVVYLVLGKMTGRLSHFRPGQTLDVWGPLGNGFEPAPVEHLIMVAGGIGQTPFLALAQEALGRRTYGSPPRPAGRAAQVTFCYGVRSREFLAGVEDFRRLGVDVRISTDDGSAGHHGFVTQLLEQVLLQKRRTTEREQQERQPCRIVCCGPEPMMAAVAQVAQTAGVPCQVSLETPMACGLGICFSCVAKIRDAEGRVDYRRTCVEGPVFDAARVEF